jgi:hypothetical protein
VCDVFFLQIVTPWLLDSYENKKQGPGLSEATQLSQLKQPLGVVMQ